MAEVSAQRASQRVVHETFNLLGVDLNDNQSVAHFRDGVQLILTRQRTRKERVELVKRGILNGFIALLFTGLTTAVALAWSKIGKH